MNQCIPLFLHDFSQVLTGRKKFDYQAEYQLSKLASLLFYSINWKKRIPIYPLRINLIFVLDSDSSDFANKGRQSQSSHLLPVLRSRSFYGRSLNTSLHTGIGINFEYVTEYRYLLAVGEVGAVNNLGTWRRSQSRKKRGTTQVPPQILALE